MLSSLELASVDTMYVILIARPMPGVSNRTFPLMIRFLSSFAFVLAFMRALRQRPFSDWAEDRVDFCRQHVLPKTRVALKYIGLYRDGAEWDTFGHARVACPLLTFMTLRFY